MAAVDPRPVCVHVPHPSRSHEVEVNECPRCKGRGWWSYHSGGPGCAEVTTLVLCEDCDGTGISSPVEANAPKEG